MSTDRDVTRMLRSWLEEGGTSLPDHVLDDVLDQLPATPQRRARRPAWRLNTMTTPIKFAAAAAAIGVLAVISGIVPRSPDTGGPNLVQSPSPSPAASPIALPDGALEAGTTYVMESRGLGPTRLIFTVPGEGWSGLRSALSVGKDPFGQIRMSSTVVWNVHTDPCNWRETALEPPVGSTVDDLATALAAQPLQNVSAVTDVTLGGYTGKRLEMTMPDDVDLVSCDKTSDGQVVFGRWNFPDDPYAPYAGPWAFGNEQRDTVYILDVAGTRLVIDASSLPDASEADLAELDQLVASIRLEASTPTPAPASSASPAA